MSKSNRKGILCRLINVQNEEETVAHRENEYLKVAEGEEVLVLLRYSQRISTKLPAF
jgi:hypothetical protein